MPSLVFGTDYVPTGMYHLGDFPPNSFIVKYKDPITGLYDKAPVIQYTENGSAKYGIRITSTGSNINELLGYKPHMHDWYLIAKDYALKNNRQSTVIQYTDNSPNQDWVYPSANDAFISSILYLLAAPSLSITRTDATSLTYVNGVLPLLRSNLEHELTPTYDVQTTLTVLVDTIKLSFILNEAGSYPLDEIRLPYSAPNIWSTPQLQPATTSMTAFISNLSLSFFNLLFSNEKISMITSLANFYHASGNAINGLSAMYSLFSWPIRNMTSGSSSSSYLNTTATNMQSGTMVLFSGYNLRCHGIIGTFICDATAGTNLNGKFIYALHAPYTGQFLVQTGNSPDIVPNNFNHSNYTRVELVVQHLGYPGSRAIYTPLDTSTLNMIYFNSKGFYVIPFLSPNTLYPGVDYVPTNLYDPKQFPYNSFVVKYRDPNTGAINKTVVLKNSTQPTSYSVLINKQVWQLYRYRPGLHGYYDPLTGYGSPHIACYGLGRSVSTHAIDSANPSAETSRYLVIFDPNQPVPILPKLRAALLISGVQMAKKANEQFIMLPGTRKQPTIYIRYNPEGTNLMSWDPNTILSATGGVLMDLSIAQFSRGVSGNELVKVTIPRTILDKTSATSLPILRFRAQDKLFLEGEPVSFLTPASARYGIAPSVTSVIEETFGIPGQNRYYVFSHYGFSVSVSFDVIEVTSSDPSLYSSNFYGIYLEPNGGQFIRVNYVDGKPVPVTYSDGRPVRVNLCTYASNIEYSTSVVAIDPNFFTAAELSQISTLGYIPINAPDSAVYVDIIKAQSNIDAALLSINTLLDPTSITSIVAIVANTQAMKAKIDLVTGAVKGLNDPTINQIVIEVDSLLVTANGYVGSIRDLLTPLMAQYVSYNADMITSKPQLLINYQTLLTNLLDLSKTSTNVAANATNTFSQMQAKLPEAQAAATVATNAVQGILNAAQQDAANKIAAAQAAGVIIEQDAANKIAAAQADTVTAQKIASVAQLQAQSALNATQCLVGVVQIDICITQIHALDYQARDLQIQFEQFNANQTQIQAALDAVRNIEAFFPLVDQAKSLAIHAQSTAQAAVDSVRTLDPSMTTTYTMAQNTQTLTGQNLLDVNTAVSSSNTKLNTAVNILDELRKDLANLKQPIIGTKLTDIQNNIDTSEKLIEQMQAQLTKTQGSQQSAIANLASMDGLSDTRSIHDATMAKGTVDTIVGYIENEIINSTDQLKALKMSYNFVISALDISTINLLATSSTQLATKFQALLQTLTSKTIDASNQAQVVSTALKAAQDNQIAAEQGLASQAQTIIINMISTQVELRTFANQIASAVISVDGAILIAQSYSSTAPTLVGQIQALQRIQNPDPSIATASAVIETAITNAKAILDNFHNSTQLTATPQVLTATQEMLQSVIREQQNTLSSYHAAEVAAQTATNTGEQAQALVNEAISGLINEEETTSIQPGLEAIQNNLTKIQQLQSTGQQISLDLQAALQRQDLSTDIRDILTTSSVVVTRELGSISAIIASLNSSLLTLQGNINNAKTNKNIGGLKSLKTNLGQLVATSNQNYTLVQASESVIKSQAKNIPPVPTNQFTQVVGHIQYYAQLPFLVGWTSIVSAYANIQPFFSNIWLNVSNYTQTIWYYTTFPFTWVINRFK